MNPWIMRSGAQKDYSCRLFCFPFAGGSASTYKDWSKSFPSTIEICPINLPGRGSRFSEAAHSDMQTLTDALVRALSTELDDKPYFFFGHSMGAMVAFELARKLATLKAPLPQHVFLSARPGPSAANNKNSDMAISDSDLIAMLGALNGTDKDVLANKELLDFMLPALRADMTLVQQHVYALKPALNCGITVFGGISDPTVSEQELLQWRLYTTSMFRLHILEGDHFFLNTQTAKLIEIIRTTIMKRDIQ